MVAPHGNTDEGLSAILHLGMLVGINMAAIAANEVLRKKAVELYREANSDGSLDVENGRRESNRSSW